MVTPSGTSASGMKTSDSGPSLSALAIMKFEHSSDSSSAPHAASYALMSVELPIQLRTLR